MSPCICVAGANDAHRRVASQSGVTNSGASHAAGSRATMGSVRQGIWRTSGTGGLGAGNDAYIERACLEPLHRLGRTHGFEPDFHARAALGQGFEHARQQLGADPGRHAHPHHALAPAGAAAHPLHQIVCGLQQLAAFLHQHLPGGR